MENETARLSREIRTIQSRVAVFAYFLAELASIARYILMAPKANKIATAYEETVRRILRFAPDVNAIHYTYVELEQISEKDRQELLTLPSVVTLEQALPGLIACMAQRDDELVKIYGSNVEMTLEEYMRLIYAGFYEKHLSASDVDAVLNRVFPTKVEEIAQLEAFERVFQKYREVFRALA